MKRVQERFDVSSISYTFVLAVFLQGVWKDLGEATNEALSTVREVVLRAWTKKGEGRTNIYITNVIDVWAAKRGSRIRHRLVKGDAWHAHVLIDRSDEV